MTYEEISTMISSIGYPYEYYQYPEGQAPSPPYILFYYPERNDFQADGKNYAKIVQLNIEFYTPEKSFTGEAAIEAVLDAYDMTYTTEEQYIESEHMYEVLYIMEVIINEQG